MISIPIAVNNDSFKWQLGLFWQQQKKLYDYPETRTHAIVIKRNYTYENFKPDTFHEIPHTMVDGICETLGNDGFYLPLNIQAGLLQVLHRISPDETIEVLDCDMFHLAPREFFDVEPNVLYCDNIYEDWHLYSKTINAHVVAPYVNTDNYYNGGFVPIVCKAQTMTNILPLWFEIHRDMLARNTDKNIKWWAGMYALQAACELKGVKMLSLNDCYIPPLNSIEGKTIAHYSVDGVWARKKEGNPVGSNKNEYTRAILEYIS